jgi:hypothetical protein
MQYQGSGLYALVLFMGNLKIYLQLFHLLVEPFKFRISSEFLWDVKWDEELGKIGTFL